MGDSGESCPQGEDAETDLSASLRKVKPPNKKKFEEDVEMLSINIRDKETELKQMQIKSPRSVLDGTRSEKRAMIDKLKQIDTDLRSLNPDIQAKKGALDRLQSTLTYRQEHKIDEAIGRLDHQLKMQNFKLSEEKKIVAEIDSLKRSKKALSQYLSMKKEIDDLRDKQRHLRDQRDSYQKNVNKLRHEEDDLKKKGAANKAQTDTLKKEIDKLYEQKRKKIQDFKALEKEYYDNKEEVKKLRKRESFKKRQEERKSTMEAFQHDIDEYVERREPYLDEINLCNTLINYLQKFQNSMDQDVTSQGIGEEAAAKSSGWSVIKAAVVTNELEDGKYVLLKKDEDNEYPVAARKPSKRNSKKGRKPSMTKPVTHTPQIFSQFASLNLNAPSTLNEIPASLEQLHARKKFYIDGGEISGLRVCTPTVDEHSEAGNTNSDVISATESALCEMSRQVSNTESTENPGEQAGFSVLDELVQVSNSELEGMSETMSEKSEDTLGRSNSDSTEHAQSEGESSEQSGNSPEKVDNKDSKQAVNTCKFVSVVKADGNTTEKANEDSCEGCVDSCSKSDLPAIQECPSSPSNSDTRVKVGSENSENNIASIRSICCDNYSSDEIVDGDRCDTCSESDVHMSCMAQPDSVSTECLIMDRNTEHSIKSNGLDLKSSKPVLS